MGLRVSRVDLSECMRGDRSSQAERHSTTCSFQLHFIGKESFKLSHYTAQGPRDESGKTEDNLPTQVTS